MSRKIYIYLKYEEKRRENGRLEKWKNGRMEQPFYIIPTFQYSIIPGIIAILP